jgi:hypothetical protein
VNVGYFNFGYYYSLVAILASCSTTRADIGPLLNAVEGFFAKLTRRRLKRGV